MKDIEQFQHPNKFALEVAEALQQVIFCESLRIKQKVKNYPKNTNPPAAEEAC